MSFAKLALLPFFAALVTARVQRVSRVLCSVSTHDDNVSFFTSEDWRRESCRSLEMASRTSRQYLAWTCYKNKSKISWILFTGIISYKKTGMPSREDRSKYCIRKSNVNNNYNNKESYFISKLQNMLKRTNAQDIYKNCNLVVAMAFSVQSNFSFNAVSNLFTP